MFLFGKCPFFDQQIRLLIEAPPGEGRRGPLTTRHKGSGFRALWLMAVWLWGWGVGLYGLGFRVWAFTASGF